LYIFSDDGNNNNNNNDDDDDDDDDNDDDDDEDESRFLYYGALHDICKRVHFKFIYSILIDIIKVSN